MNFGNMNATFIGISPSFFYLCLFAWHFWGVMYQRERM